MIFYVSEIVEYGAAFTLPGVGIFVNPNDVDNIDLLRHEFGHILQARNWGMNFFYEKIVPASLKSASGNKYWHMNTWTEWSANRLSYIYFGKPDDWNHSKYPIWPTKSRPGVMNPWSNGPFDFKFNWLDK